MPVSSSDLERILTKIADKEDLKVTVNSSVRGGITAGVSATIGGVLLGPPGLAIGGIVGGLAAYLSAPDFKPVSEVIKSLDRHEREKLLTAIREICGNLEVYDFFTFLRYLNGEGGWLRRQIINTTMGFLQNELKSGLKYTPEQ